MPPDIPVTIETPEGDPATVLTGMADTGDLLVVGTGTGHGMKRALHGSVSRYCTRNARCRVVVVPAGGPGGPPAEEGGLS